MSIAGTLIANNLTVGATPLEIADIAKASIGQTWSSGGCVAFVWGVSNLAGVPWYTNHTTGGFNGNATVGNNPLTPDDKPYFVPHTHYNINVPSDGWASATSYTTAVSLKANLQIGDVVRVYKSGNTTEASFDSSSHPAAHSFVVTGVSGGQVLVTDNWNGHSISEHNFNDIAAAYAAGGSFQSAFITRLDTAWVSSNVTHTLQGWGTGDFSALSAPVYVFTAGNDTVTLPGPGKYHALAGDDVVTGTSGKDKIFGDAGNDILNGGAGNDKLIGGTGNDTLIGGAGKDVVKGGKGIDGLNGGAGNDKLIGGAGWDAFVFFTGDDKDKIKDFTDNVDVLALDHTLHGGIATAADALALAHDNGHDIVFHFGAGDTLILKGVGGAGTAFLLDDITIV